MPAVRIVEILAEIGALTKNQRIQDLTVELGSLLATSVDNTSHIDARLTRLKSDTTLAITDTEATLEDHIIDLRTSVLGLTQLFRRRMTDIEERNQTITGRVHTLANHMMAVEQKVNELAEVLTALLERSNATDEDDYNTTDDYNNEYGSDIVN